jgi:hypothetical protein
MCLRDKEKEKLCPKCNSDLHAWFEKDNPLGRVGLMCRKCGFCNEFIVE